MNIMRYTVFLLFLHSSTDGYILRDQNLMEEEDSGKKLSEKSIDRGHGNLMFSSEKSLPMDVNTYSKYHRVKRSEAILPLTQQDKDDILLAHNSFRSYIIPQASNMNKLVS